MKYLVHGYMTVSCWTEVDAESVEEAIELAGQRDVAEVITDGGYPVDEYWIMDCDGEPTNFTATTED